MTAALIVAAGRTDRKDAFSPEKQYGCISAIERIALLLRLAGLRCIVVVGEEKELPQKLAASMGLIFLPAPAGGEMLDSIRAGLSYLRARCARVLIAPVDVPVFSVDTVQRLLAADAPVCIPSCHGRGGHPIALRADCFDAVLAYRGGGGLRGAITASGLARCFVETEDVGVLPDGALGAAYESLLPGHDVARLRASCTLSVGREKTFYDPTAHLLLHLTEELGSLSAACQHMGLSYSKGRKMVAVMEEQLGFAVLETRQGGKDGGSSRLTDGARSLMRRYSALEEEMEAALAAVFARYFSDFLPQNTEERSDKA